MTAQKRERRTGRALRGSLFTVALAVLRLSLEQTRPAL